MGTAGFAARGVGPRHVGHWVLRTNTVTFPFHTHLDLRDEHLHVRATRLLLGLVPAGRTDVEIHVRDIESAHVDTAVHPARLAVAVVAFALGVLAEPWPLTALLVFLGVGFALLGVIKVLRIERSVGPRLTVPVCVVQRGVAAAVARQIERAAAAARGER